MYQENLKERVLSGLFWKVMENGGTQGIQFLVSVLLARLLTPSESGEVMLIMIFITIGNVFVQSGFNTSLIQKQEVDERDYSSAFCVSFLIAFILYVILFFSAPAIGNFYGQPVFVPVLRILSLTLFFGAVVSVQSASVSRNMEFRKLCMASLFAAAGSGIIGVLMALEGFGLWSLAMQQFFYSFFLMIVLHLLKTWKPSLKFSFQKARDLFSYGWKILMSGLIDTVFTNVYGLVIGKLYNSAMMGQYSRGNQFPALIANNLGAAIQSVMLPAFSACQDDREKGEKHGKKIHRYKLLSCLSHDGGINRNSRTHGEAFINRSVFTMCPHASSFVHRLCHLAPSCCEFTGDQCPWKK